MARFGRRETRLRIFPGRGVALSAADVQTVCPILSNALSLDESAFGQIENRQEFCFCLLEIVTARDSGRRDDVRLLASVVLVMNTNYFAQSASEPSLAMALQQAGLSINQKVKLQWLCDFEMLSRQQCHIRRFVLESYDPTTK
ncbi:Importin-beta N-terminal domain [Musa troglodytarum]|uniref:Importin-beta N-terminal domain n=1 Tax=Musa troglodytarum TaxID=320322 RepID=A0A9E7KFE9_9LILI|nr:Importin-beta N-terminal domain [Musa troglodytarum]